MATKKKSPKSTPVTERAARLANAATAKAKSITPAVEAEETPVAEPKATKAPAAKPAKAGDGKSAKMSALDAAAKVLAESGPLNAKQMIEAMATKGYWTSPGGKTPHATLYSAILREIEVKKGESRFKKVERGQFAVR